MGKLLVRFAAFGGIGALFFAACAEGSPDASGSGGSGGSGGSEDVSTSSTGGALPCGFEMCDSGADCPDACAPVPSWAQRFGDMGEQVVRAFEVAPDGSLLVAGYYSGTIDLGLGTPSSATNKLGGDAFEAYVAKLDPSGKPLWIRSGGSRSVASDVAPMESGDTIWTGQVVDSAFQKIDVIVRRENNGSAAQEHVWETTFGSGTGGPLGAAVVVSGAKVFVAGTVDGTGSFPPSCGVSYSDLLTPWLFVVQLDADSGACQWVRAYAGGLYHSDSISMVIDPAGNLVVAGVYEGAGVGGTAMPATSESQYATYILKLSSLNGDILDSAWVVTTNVAGSAYVMDVAVAQDNIFLAGSLQGAAKIGAQELVSSDNGSSIDALVMALDNDLNFLWAERFGGTFSSQGATNIRADATGHLFVTGVTDGPMALDPQSDEGTLCGVIPCLFLLKLDQATGEPIWGEAFGHGELSYYARAHVAATSDALLLAAGMSQTFSLGATVVPNDGSDLDIVVARISPAP